jgi:hypothetical protein
LDHAFSPPRVFLLQTIPWPGTLTYTGYQITKGD